MVENKEDYGAVSLAFGVMSVVLSFTIFLGILAGVVGVVFATKQRKVQKSNLSTPGLVTSIIGLVLSGVALITFLLGVIFLGKFLYFIGS